MARSKKQRERVSAAGRARDHASGFTSTTMKTPDGVKFFKLDSDKTRRIDIIPYRAGVGNPYSEEGGLYSERTFYIHYRCVGPNNDSYICPLKTLKKPCPICEYRSKLANDPESDEDEVKALAPKERQLWNIVDATKPDEGVQLWDMSFHMFGKLLDKYVRDADDDDNFEFYADPEDGFTLKLSVDEKKIGKGRPFYEVVAIQFKERPEPIDEDLLAEAMCLDDMLVITPYDKLKALFLEQGGDDDEDDEPKPRKRRKVKDEDDDDEDDEPKPRKRRKQKQEVEDDEDEDEDEPKRPTGKKRTRKSSETSKTSSSKKKEVEDDDDDGDDDWDFDD